jgi:hypothetical protein
MRLRSDLVLLPLDDELVVFSEEAQCLVGLNAAAAFVLRELRDGTAPSQLAQDLAAERIAAPQEAERWVAAALEALGSHGMLADRPVPVAAPSLATLDIGQSRQIAPMYRYQPVKDPVTERRYRLLDTCALIRFGHLEQVRLVDAVIGHLATDDAAVPNLVMDIWARTMPDGHVRSDVYRDGEPIGCVWRLSHLGPVVKAALWQSAINARDFLFYIHAGVVGTGQGCILLPAAAGSGKSSLTAALTLRGFRYFSDEVALIDRTTFRVPPMPLAISVKSTGWDLMSRYYPDLAALPIHVRIDGKRLRYVPPPPGAAQHAPALVSHIIFPRYDKDARTEIQPIARSAALSRLMGECLALSQRLDRRNVEDIVRWIAGIACYTLTFSSLDEAAELVAQASL